MAKMGRPRKYPAAMVGDRFGQWTVIAYWLPDVNHHNSRRVCVRCDCGVWRVHRENLLVSGKTKSCGHLYHPYGTNPWVVGEPKYKREKKEKIKRAIQETIDKVKVRTGKEILEDRYNDRDKPASDASHSRPSGVGSAQVPTWHRRAAWPLD